MVSTDTIRRIQINTTTSGIDQATAGLGRLKGAEDGVVISSDKLTRSQLSVATQLDALQRRYDLAYRGAGELAKAEQTLAAARAQGLVSAEREAAILTSVSAKYDLTSASAKRLGVALEGLKTVGSIAFGFVGIAALAELPSAVSGAIRSVGELAAASDRAGVSAEKLQVLRQVFKDNGGEAETADAALTALNTRLGNLANTAAGPAAAAMKTLGIGFASITSLSPDEKFDVIAKKLAGISDPARRAGLAADLFGKTAGPELAGLLGQSNQVIDQTHQKMVDLGSLMGNTTVAQGAKLDAAFQEWTSRWRTNFESNIVTIADKLWELADGFRAVNQQTNLTTLQGELDATATKWQNVTTLLSEAQGRLAQASGNGPSDPATILAQGYISNLGQQATSLQAQMNAINDQLLKLNQPLTRTNYDSPPLAPPPAKPMSEADRLNNRNFPLSIVPEVDEGTSAMDQFNQRLSTAEDLTKGFASTFTDDLRQGKSVIDSLSDAVSDLAGKLLDMVEDNAISSLFKNLGGIFGGVAAPASAAVGGVGLGMGALYADGGPVRGPGTGRSDSILARVSNGEYIVNATATAMHRPMLDAINSGGGGVRRFADGGIVDRIFPTFADGGVVRPMDYPAIASSKRPTNMAASIR